VRAAWLARRADVVSKEWPPGGRALGRSVRELLRTSGSGRTAPTGAVVATVGVQPVALEYAIRLRNFLADREISSGANRALYSLPDMQSPFVAQPTLGRRFFRMVRDLNRDVADWRCFDPHGRDFNPWSTVLPTRVAARSSVSG
jgi:hypothetical protein